MSLERRRNNPHRHVERAVALSRRRNLQFRFLSHETEQENIIGSNGHGNEKIDRKDGKKAPVTVVSLITAAD